jgi:hypothetical protein
MREVIQEHASSADQLLTRRQIIARGFAAGLAATLPGILGSCKDGEGPTQESIFGRFDLEEAKLGFAGAHAALLHTGRVLLFSYDPRRENDENLSLWHLWDPQGGLLAPGPIQHDRNVFCSGHAFLPDGRLLVAGGQSYNWWPFWGVGADHDIHTFDPTSERWTRHKDMPAARWYPTCLTMADGRAIIVGGHAVRFRPTGANNDEFEIFSGSDNSKSQPRTFNPGYIDGAYPFLKLLADGSPQGLAFVYSKDEARLFDLNSMTWLTSRFLTGTRSRTYNRQGSSVLLPLPASRTPPAKVLVVGGEGKGDRATNTAQIFEFDPQEPTASSWRVPSGGHMPTERFMGDSVILADGTVLVVNGAASGVADSSDEPVLQAVLFDPESETWAKLASLNHPRMYHSAAVLLHDGRVLISGNTEHWNPNNAVEDDSLDIFSPPYLFRSARPTIEDVSSELGYGQEFRIGVSNEEEVARIALVKSSSTTHSNNMDQRYLRLGITARGAGEIRASSPATRILAPPGFYILFLLSKSGVPSVGKFVHLS